MENISQPKRYPQFFQNVMPYILEDGTFEIPQNFVEKHGIHWPKYACLEVSTSKMWKVQLRTCDGRVWLHKGWKEFVGDCSIQCGYSLVFRYEGGSFFRVFIFDTSRLEIEYPEDQRVNLDQPKVVNTEEEVGEGDDSSVEILADWTPKTKQASDLCVGKSRTQLHSSSSIEYNSEVLRGKGLALQRARVFRSPNPHFIVIIKPEYDSHLELLDSNAISYFQGRDDNDIYLMGPDEIAWAMKYSVGDPPLHQVRIVSGWKEFSQNYHLRDGDGDACIFEILKSKLMAFNITLFQTNEEGEAETVNRKITEQGDGKFTDEGAGEGQVSRNKHFVMPDTPNPTHARRRESLEGGKPSFTVVLKRKTEALYKLSLPLAHGSRYLSGQHNKQVLLHGLAGQIWPTKCYICGSNVRFSTGWKEFVVDNHLEGGDTCVFELQSQAPNHYNVTILRAAQSAIPN